MPFGIAPQVFARRVAGGLAIAAVLAAPPLSAQPSARADDVPALRQRMDCSMLARQPNPALTVAECERRKASYGQLDSAVHAPEGERPGDEALTCTEAIAEMQSLRFSGVAADTARENVAAGEQLREAVDSGDAAAGAMAARHTAETMAVAAMPNAVQGVVAYRHAAEQVALGQANTARMAAARGRAADASGKASEELATALHANPRFARLMRLVQQKNCQFGDAPAAPAVPTAPEAKTR